MRSAADLVRPPRSWPRGLATHAALDDPRDVASLRDTGAGKQLPAAEPGPELSYRGKMSTIATSKIAVIPAMTVIRTECVLT